MVKAFVLLRWASTQQALIAHRTLATDGGGFQVFLTTPGGSVHLKLIRIGGARR